MIAIRKRLSELEYPIYFFDFETYSYAIPRFEGFAPYQAFPFQYSCHVLDADRNLSHRDYLHDEDSDPRMRLLEHLIDHIGSKGSIVVYYAPFERTVLSQLAKAFRRVPRAGGIHDRQTMGSAPDLSTITIGILVFWDRHRSRRVLPVLVPSLSYDDLDVQRGDDAQAIWQQNALLCQSRGERSDAVGTAWPTASGIRWPWSRFTEFCNDPRSRRRDESLSPTTLTSKAAVSQGFGDAITFEVHSEQRSQCAYEKYEFLVFGRSHSAPTIRRARDSVVAVG